MELLKSAFIKLLSMSNTASIVILVVIIARLVLKKAPKKFSYLLWSVVGFRLICPVSFSSVLSIFNAKTVYQSVSRTVLQNPAHAVDFSSTVNNITKHLTKPIVIANPVSNATAENITVNIDIATIIAIVWATVAVALLVYGIVSYIRISSTVKTAIKLQNNVYKYGGIKTPFVLGILRPKIYLPLGLKDDEFEYILRHEQYHIRRFDHIVKPLAFIILSVYWMNPLVWLAYYLMSSDMEMSCDEKVLSQMNYSVKKDYSLSLLSLAVNKSFAGPLAFAESNVQSRIKNVLKLKKPKKAVMICSIVLSAVVLVACMSNGVVQKLTGKKIDDKLDTAVHSAILDQSGGYKEGKCKVEAHEVLGVDEQEEKVSVYAVVMYKSYDYIEEKLYNITGSNCPVVLTFAKSDGDYNLTEYWVPEDGSLYTKSIKAKFPSSISNEAIDGNDKLADKLDKRCREQALKYFKENNVVYTQADQVKVILDNIDIYNPPEAFRGKICYMGQENWVNIWNNFYVNTKNGKSDSIIICRYTIEGDIIYQYVSYDGNEYYVLEDDSHDKYASQEYVEFTGKYLLEDTSSGTVYIITDDKDLTAQDLFEDMISSRYVETRGYIVVSLYDKLLH